MNLARAAGAVGGGLLAGLAFSALMIAGERRSGEPSEQIALERAGAERLGAETPPGSAPPAPREEAAAQAVHLALSAASGLAYVALFDEDAPAVPAGIGFGLGFWALAHGVAGPALGLVPAEWRLDARTVGTHVVTHALFGLAVAGGARAGEALAERGRAR